MRNKDDLDATESFSPDHGSLRGQRAERFLPGAVLAKRYRVAGLLGRGGMGEVYRADDLKLGQAVALKFLPDTADDDARLERLFNEVRLARQVSHPNVCRVFDVGEVAGQHFIAMEYVDGEDLASLLRRIGRLPQEKAVEIARQLCAGLATAHDQGILHRDLKPANIMVDGRGRVRITDFGLASLADELEGAEIRAGTPLYMSPEQLEGDEVTTRSDIYALGLVLYELFTGERPFAPATAAGIRRSRRETTPTPPSSHIEGLDTAIETAILRCLEPDPEDRPPNALSVAAALPGGDPLAAALAAGETPSPEMVAAAPTEGTLRPGVAVAWLVATIVLLGLGLLASREFMIGLGDKPPAVMVDRAQQQLETLGYAGQPLDSAFGYFFDPGYVLYLDSLDPDEYRRRVTDDPDAAIRFWYRTSPEWLEPRESVRQVNLEDPPFDVPGMTTLVLDADGRLIRFDAVPGTERDTEVEDFEPRSVLAIAGLEEAAFVEDGAGSPWFHADGSMVWRNRTASESPERVEAVWKNGRATSVRLLGGWPPGPDAGVLNDPGPLFTVLLLLLQIIVLVAGLVLVRRTLASGRGDRRGAFRLAVFFFVLGVVNSLLWSHHTPTLGEFDYLWRTTALNLLLAVIVWALYLGIEPFVRRRWPQSIISWTRLLAGRLRDPLVGRDLLIGTAVGMGFVLILWVGSGIRAIVGQEPLIGYARSPDSAIGLSGPAGAVFKSLGGGVLLSLGLLVFLLALTLLLRSDRLAGLAFWAAMTLGVAASRQDLAALPAAAVAAIGMLLTLRRGGLLLMIAAMLASHIPLFGFMLPDLGSWYGKQAIGLAVVTLVPAVWGLVHCLDRRPATGVGEPN